MTNAVALDAPQPLRSDRIEHAGYAALIGIAATLHFSIAAAQILLTIAVVLWVSLLLIRHERIEAPAFFWPLALYAGLTLMSAAFSIDPRTSFVDCKQLLLFLIVPLTYRLASGSRGITLVTVVITCAAVSAVFGIIQYGILHFDLGNRPRGTLGHYMTYAGLLMLVICVTIARILFLTWGRLWAALVTPALVVAVAVTSTRSAAVGVCVAVALLFALKDFRLFSLVPIVAAIFFAFAPQLIMQRFASMFDARDPTRIDRVAMLREGGRMIAAHPLTGVGPNMVERRYEEFRGSDAVNKVNPHLHNNPIQIAAERGLPALAVWLWFIAMLIRDLARKTRSSTLRSLPTAALAGVVAMLAAGMFEYNFGDSEFLMLFLLLVTLPYAADRVTATTAPAVAQRHAA
jgi:O-antigen ligase